jgi:peptide/nickel transport system permease protein
MDSLMRTLRPWSARLALLVLLCVVVLVAFGARLAPYDPLHQDVANLLRGPSARHWLGTDYLGRDVLSRLLAGTRISVLTALESIAAALLFGALPGLLSVFAGRWFDFIANRIADAVMTLPILVFAIAMIAVLGNRLVPVMLAIGFLVSPHFFRLTRAATLQYSREQYVQAAELFGASRARIVRVHVLRKVLPTVYVATATYTAGALLTVSSLNFLGIGVIPPAPTWGGVLSSDLTYLSQAPWAPLAPAALIMLTVGALHALADAIRDATGVHIGRSTVEEATEPDTIGADIIGAEIIEPEDADVVVDRAA